jgi:hypothetical protein
MQLDGISHDLRRKIRLHQDFALLFESFIDLCLLFRATRRSDVLAIGAAVHIRETVYCSLQIVS